MAELKDKTKQWLDAVANGKLNMSQRKVDALIKTEGSLQKITNEAHKKGVHLVQLVDDKGTHLIAASMHPFRTLC